ncbi:MarR family winged helix-turn-helix transcriptional regulator [Gordonia soli]|uniref:Putative MarR family transcriptional regulator n=1 Tax=Gordonia soli NBRC 108243 TaxID=1223545 RepID=M0QIN4_9ACTN|nr:MarR family transcriptional regulator [Gordonia soli]GAC67297.1 putative MarR family transcriptional regulator [Gordonia soli NBRC 108243]
MTPPGVPPEPTVERLTLSIEDFNTVFIRLASSDRMSFSALSVMHTLSRRGPCRLSDLVGTEQIKQSALTTAVAKLESDGLLARRPDPADGRAALLSLTAAGRKVVSRRHSERAERMTELLAELPPADRTRLLEVADVLDHVVRIAARRDAETGHGR